MENGLQNMFWRREHFCALPEPPNWVFLYCLRLLVQSSEQLLLPVYCSCAKRQQLMETNLIHIFFFYDIFQSGVKLQRRQARPIIHASSSSSSSQRQPDWKLHSQVFFSFSLLPSGRPLPVSGGSSSPPETKARSLSQWRETIRSKSSWSDLTSARKKSECLVSAAFLTNSSNGRVLVIKRPEG